MLHFAGNEKMYSTEEKNDDMRFCFYTCNRNNNKE